jgi:hypothetical protein
MRFLSRLGLSLLGVWASVSAQAQPLRVDQSAERMRVDGALGEWKGAHFAQLGDGDDASLRYALASTDGAFYLAAEIADDQLVLKDEVGPGQDALVLSLALPDAAGALRVSEVWLHPGRAGKQAAKASVQGFSGSAKVQVVEGPRARGPGYVIEALVPFASLGGAELWEQGRASLRFEDVDRAGQKPEITLASASGKPADWPRIALGVGQNDFLGSFLSEKSLSGVEPRFDQRANVAGDATLERVLIVDKYVLVYGKGFKRGENYAYFALPYSVGGGLVSAQLADLTSDGRAELLARVRQRNELGARELFLVIELAEDSIAPLFSLELKKEAKGGFIECSVSVDKKSAPPRIQVSVGRAEGLDARTYQENPATDALPILLPWGAVESRSYAFDGDKFAQVAEKAQSPISPPDAGAAAARATATSQVGTPAAQPSAVPTTPMSDLAKAILRAPPLGTFRFDREANLVGGPGKERAFVHERQVVATGPELGPAPTYVAYGPPIESAEDLLGLDAADVTGDGLAELLVRQRMRSSGAEHELLLVLQLQPTGAQPSARRLIPLLVAEVVRRRGADAIVNLVQAKAGKLSIAPGKAQGFSQTNYPFAHEASPGIEPLLLPWLDDVRRYRFDGTRLRAE